MGRLTGLRVVVTRAAEQAEDLARPLREAGADVVVLPAIAIAAPSDPAALRAAAHRVSDYDWLLLTSANAVETFLPLVPPPVPSSRPRLAVVGKTTRTLAATRGWNADLIPAEFTAEALAAEFEKQEIRGLRFLMPSGDLAREVLPRRLSKRGAIVDVVEAYRTVMPPDMAVRAHELLQSESPPDWIVLASPSAMENLVRAVGVETLRQVKLASIGPATSTAVRAAGLEVTAEAQEHTVAGLVDAVIGHST